MLREIACHRKCHSDHAALGRAIGHLPYLPVESRHRRRVDDDASFSIKLVNTASVRSVEHTSELQSLMRISYAVFCLKKKIQHNEHNLCTNTQYIDEQTKSIAD